METYIQYKLNDELVYKPIIGISFKFAKDSDIPANGLAIDSKIQANRMIKRNANEVWYVESNKYDANKKTKTLVWQQAKIVEIVTELGNTLQGDPKGEKYFIREDPIKDAIVDVAHNHLSASFIKEDKNAIHLPVDAEEVVPVRQNDNGEDVTNVVV